MRFRLPLLAAIVVAFVSFPIVTALADSHAQTAGFTLQALSKDDLDAIQRGIGQRVGVLVTAVAPGSAAEKAGSKPGDVLFTVGGKGVDSPDAVDQALEGKTGNVEFVGVRKNGEKFEAFKLTLAVPDADPTALTHKPGKTFQHAIGFQFWYPADWQVNPLQDNMAQLVPGDAALPANAPGEYYVILGDAIGNSGITKPDDPRLIALLDQAIPGLAQLVPNMPAQFQKVGQPQSFPMARGLGCVADWEGNAPNGTIVRTRAFACVMDGYVVGLLAMRPRDRLAARDETLRSIFGSFGFGQSQKDPGCLGIWFYESDTIVGNYSSSSARTYRFAPDGSFQTRSKFFATTGSTDQGGNLTGSTNADVAAGDRGKWAAANGRLYLFFDDGSESDYNYTVEGQGNNRAIILHFANGKVQMWTYKGRP